MSLYYALFSYYCDYDITIAADNRQILHNPSCFFHCTYNLLHLQRSI